MTKFGNLDIPVLNCEQDKLFMESQISGMARFIEECSTPMTISIQGTWGSGKTSFVNMVVDRIQKDLGKDAEKDFAYVQFNSWQFVQFNLSDQLCASMVTAITKELAKGIKSDPTVKERVDRIINGVEVLKASGRLAAIVLNEIVKEKADVDVLSTLKDAGLTDTDKLSAKEDSITAVDTIRTLQKDLKKTIEARLGITEETVKTLSEEELNRKRVIVFVDDLDRLAPDKAIEVLETLKMFFENDHCIFLLAIDQDVIVNGVTVKFKNTINADKGRDFFEKLIQVVYTLPDKMTNTDQYIAYLLQESGESIAHSYEFSELVHAAGKETPRAVKRLINSYKLIRMMWKQSHNDDDTEASLVVIFALLCLQSTCPEVYESISSIFAGKCDYVKCVKWFNQLHLYAFEIYHLEHSSVTVSRNRLRKWNLLNNNEPDRLKIGLILKVFDHASSTFYGDIVNPGHQLTIREILRIRDVIKWTNLITSKGEAHSGLFSVAIVDVENCAEEHLKTGTALEAYRVSFEKMMSYLLSEDYVYVDAINNDPWYPNGQITETKKLIESPPEERLAIVADLFDGLISLDEKTTKRKNWYSISTPLGIVGLNEFQDDDTLDRMFLITRMTEIFAEILGIRITWYADRFKTRPLFNHQIDRIDGSFTMIGKIPFIEAAGKVSSNRGGTIEEAYYLTVQSILDDLPYDNAIEVVKAHTELFEVFDPSGYPDAADEGSVLFESIDSIFDPDSTFTFEQVSNSDDLDDTPDQHNDGTYSFEDLQEQDPAENTRYADDLEEVDPIARLDIMKNVITEEDEEYIPAPEGNWRDMAIVGPDSQYDFKIFIGSEEDEWKRSCGQFDRLYSFAKELDVDFKWYGDEYMQDTVLKYSHITLNNKVLGTKYLKKIFEKYPQLFY